MDVGSVRIRAGAWVLLAIGLPLFMAAQAQADPLYTAIDLGTGAPTFGNGTVTGSNGQTYAFDNLPDGASVPPPGSLQNLPNVVPAPVNDPTTYGNPAFAYSRSTLVQMNSQGLAVGLDSFGVAGHLGNTEAFLTQHQADGSWSTPIPLWSGMPGFGGSGGEGGIGILGLTTGGLVLGNGSSMGHYAGLYGNGPPSDLLLYDSKSRSFTDISNLIDSTLSPSKRHWFLNMPFGTIDNQGRILLTSDVTDGLSGPQHSLLLVPQGLPGNEVAAPEPSAWLLFAILAGGGLARNRLRPDAPRA